MQLHIPLQVGLLYSKYSTVEATTDILVLSLVGK